MDDGVSWGIHARQSIEESPEEGVAHATKTTLADRVSLPIFASEPAFLSETLEWPS